MKSISQVMIIIIVMLLLGSCKQEQAVMKNDDIIELKFWGEGSTEWFITELEAPLKAKYPNIKLTLLKQPTLKQAITENNAPDIMLEPVYWQSPESAQQANSKKSSKGNPTTAYISPIMTFPESPLSYP